MINNNYLEFLRTPLILALITPLSLVANAESDLAEPQKEEIKNISDAIGPGDSNSKWVVGAYVGSVTDPYADEDSKDFIVPNIEYRGEYFFVSKDGIGFNLLRWERFSVGLLMTGEDSLLSDKDDYDDNKTLLGLDERDDTLSAGMYFQHTTPMGQLKVILQDEITGEHGGQSALAKYTFDYEYKNININPVVGVSWSSADTVDHFFGVSDDEANANRASYRGHSATSFFTGVRARYTFTKNWDVDLAAAYVNLGDGLEDSSIVEKDDLFISAIGINYNF